MNGNVILSISKVSPLGLDIIKQKGQL